MLESILFGEATPSENTQNIIQMIMEAPAFILATTVAGPHHGRVRIPPQHTGDHQSVFKFLGRGSDQLFAVCVCS